MGDENEALNERLFAQSEPDDRAYLVNRRVPAPSDESPKSATDATTMDLCQWQVGTNGTFRPAAKTIQSLKPGAYSVEVDNFGPYLKEQPLLCDNIVDLPEAANARVLSSIQRFWGSANRYRDHGLLFKRGILLWGPPGSGKTVTVHLLTRDLIQRGGIVIFCGHPELTKVLVSAVRRIERDRPLIVVLEDIDEIIGRHGEHEILSMLDGENQTDNVVSIATTNYPERLGARIVNRPSRFDERIFIGMPSLASRVAYLQSATSNGSRMDDSTIKQWAQDTDGFSIAHLRELVAAVLCLDQQYEDVVNRLRSMNERPRDVDGFSKRQMGLAASNSMFTQAGRATR